GLEARHPRRTKFDRRHFCDVGKGPYGHAAWRRQRLGSVDGNYFSVRMGRAHDAHVQLAGKGSAHGEAALSGDERQILQARYRFADEGVLHRSFAAAARTALRMFW